jgi:Tol biopolymer transport system component/serine/threonine protein kinase
MRLKEGTRIGRYEIRDLLGAGGMGEVYLATDAELSRPVALKFLRAEVASDERRMRRFIQEARAASALNHPNILTVYDVGQTEDGTRFLATEFVGGTTLREHTQGRRLKPGEALDICTQVASALAAAHEAGIVHRDIKPENIMIRRDSIVKVLDFGLAKLTALPAAVNTEAATRALVETDPGAVMGTVAYMSPEQAQGLEVDARTDIWSLGVVLYELLTGRVPFAGKSPSHTVVAILDSEPPPLSRLMPEAPEALQEVVTDALTKDRDARFQTAKQMLAKLQRLKARLDAGAHLDHSASPEAASQAAAADAATAPGGPAAQSTSSMPPPSPTQTAAAPTAPHVSSAEYVFTQIKSHKKIFTAALLVALAALAFAGFGLYKFFGRGESARSGAPLKVTPLTSSPYPERNVAFSPDGRQVAYVWTGEKGDNFDLYVKLIGAGEPLRLTNSLGLEMSPAWSPDGRYIAFLRGRSEGIGFYIIPALGGAERKLADAYGWAIGGAKPNALDWSPDGKTLAVVDKTSEDEPWSIFLISVETGERRRLTQPPAGYAGDTSVSFSPDGSRLAFVRARAFGRMDVLVGVGDVYTVAVAGGEPARVTSDEASVSGLAWTPDGAGLVFSSNRAGGDPILWRVPATGGTPAMVAGVGENVYELSIARQGDRLAYAQRSSDFDIYRLELTNQAGGRRGAGAPVSFISSTRLEGSPQFSPDGRRVAFMSNRSGSKEIWACDAEGKNLVQLTNFGGPHTDTPSWSPDGRLIAFTSFPGGNGDIYVVNADGGSPRRLTTEPSAETEPSWSRDGRWIYFTSNRTGRNEVWKMPAAGGAAIQLTRGGGRTPVESPDGRTVYYEKGRGELGLWQVSTEGGEETQVFEANVDPGNWAVAERGIYFLGFHLLNQQPRQPGYTLGFFDFATRQTTQLATLEGPIRTFQISGLTVSPDEHWVLYAQRDKLDFDLMLVENFR